MIATITTMLLFWYIDGECPVGSVKKTYPKWAEFYDRNVNFFRLWPIMVILILIVKLFR